VAIAGHRGTRTLEGILIVLGALAPAYQGITYTTCEKVLDTMGGLLILASLGLAAYCSRLFTIRQGDARTQVAGPSRT